MAQSPEAANKFPETGGGAPMKTACLENILLRNEISEGTNIFPEIRGGWGMALNEKMKTGDGGAYFCETKFGSGEFQISGNGRVMVSG